MGFEEATAAPVAWQGNWIIADGLARSGMQLVKFKHLGGAACIAADACRHTHDRSFGRIMATDLQHVFLNNGQ